MVSPQHPDPLNISQAILYFNKAQSYDDLKKVINDVNKHIQNNGSDIVKNLWDLQKNQIVSCLNQKPVLEIDKIKVIIERMLNELKSLNDQHTPNIVNVPASNKPVANLYERVSHFVQARKEHRAVLRQEKNAQLNKIDAIIKQLHLIKKELMQNLNENQLNDLKSETSAIKERIHEISQSRAYQKSNTVMMNADSAMSKMAGLNTQIDKKIIQTKSKKNEQIYPAGIMKKILSRAAKKKVQTSSSSQTKSKKDDNPDNDDHPPHRSKK